MVVAWLACSGLSPLVAQVEPAPNYTAEAFFKIDGGQRTGQLFVSLECADDWVGYSNTTPAGGPLPTKLTVTSAETFSVTGDFSPMKDPHRKLDTAIGAEVHYHPAGVTWVAPIQLAENVSPADLEINVSIKGQVCSDGESGGKCGLVNDKLVAGYAGETETPELEPELQLRGTHTIWTGRVTPSNAKPGDTVSVELTAEPQGHYKIYNYSADAQDSISLPTRIALQRSHGWAMSAVQADSEPLQKMSMGEQQSFYYDPVSWTFDLTVPADAKPGKFSFAGLIGFQNCTETGCDRPSGTQFQFDIVVGETTTDEAEIGFGSGSYRDAESLANRKAKEAKLLK